MNIRPPLYHSHLSQWCRGGWCDVRAVKAFEAYIFNPLLPQNGWCRGYDV